MDNEKITGLDCTFVALAFLAFISVPSFAAHFNCETAEHPNKKLICANKELSELDDQKTKLFNDLLEHYSSRTKLQETEGQWEKKLLDCGNDFICTKKLYRERIKQLSAMLVEAKKISEWKQNLILTLAGTLQSPPPPPVASMRAAPEAPLRIANIALRIDKSGFVKAALILSNSSDNKDLEDAALERVRTMQPFPPPPKEWKGRSIDVIVPIGPDPRLDFDGAIPFSASDTSPNVSDLLTLLESAQTGEETSQYLLGKKYLDGGEVSLNVSEAISWLQKSAEKDHAESEYLLGIIYEYGLGISPDMTKAISWFRKASDHGHAAAKASLARIQPFDTSSNVSDLTLLESAQKGETTSQYLLGKKILSRNVSVAISWLQKSAEKDHAESEYLLGIIYECISPDMTKAISWFSKAAEHGNNDAKAALRQLQRQ